MSSVEVWNVGPAKTGGKIGEVVGYVTGYNRAAGVSLGEDVEKGDWLEYRQGKAFKRQPPKSVRIYASRFLKAGTRIDNPGDGVEYDLGESVEKGDCFALDLVEGVMLRVPGVKSREEDLRDRLSAAEDLDGMVQPMAMALFESHPDVAAIRQRTAADLSYDAFYARAWDLGEDGEKNPAEGRARLWCFQEARRLVDRVRGRRDGLGWKAHPADVAPRRILREGSGVAGMSEAVEVKPF